MIPRLTVVGWPVQYLESYWTKGRVGEMEMDWIPTLFENWRAIPLYRDPVLYLGIAMTAPWLYVTVRDYRTRRRNGLSKEERRAQKAKHDLENQRLAQERMARLKAAWAKRRAQQKREEEPAARRLVLPDPLRTNSTTPYIAERPPEDAAGGRNTPSPLSWGHPAASAGYRDFRMLGSGGFADVMFAHTKHGAPVAIKTLRLTSSDREHRERWFRREVRLLSELTSPAIPRLIEHRLEIPDPYFVMEYIDGHNLAEYISKNGPLRDMNWVGDLAILTANAIDEMHGKGFIHRDIKPANVMVTETGGRFRLIDLGIGKDTGSESTASQVTAGTLAFAAPESIDGKAGTMADIFSWGATIGYAMTGRTPYGAQSGSALLLKIMKGEIDPGFLAAVDEAGKSYGSTTGPLLAKVVATSVRPDPSSRSAVYLEALSNKLKQ